ncbi:FMRFamide receptor [Plakobranchus ocellatus]|uniref:FMRFamide receptor n=1 Tax=Plakobranchus ocellatus TaxID=259542 RepID=A0AAV4AGS2_9GAST|nr:FMRFamide receptor [Plakobranchus ocellatus]
MNDINLKVNISYDNSNLSDEVSSGALYLFVMWGILLPLVALAGLVGNVLTILVLWRREMHSTTILYMRGLVITDTGILIGSVVTLTPIACANYLPCETSSYFKDNVYPFLHTPGYYIIMTLQQINVWITVSVSVERYIAICHPYRAARLISRKKTLAVILAIALFSLLYNLPHLFASTTTPCGGERTKRRVDNDDPVDDTDVISVADKGFEYSLKNPSIHDQTGLYLALPSTISPQILFPEQPPALLTAQPPNPASFSSSCVEVITTGFGLSSFYTFYRTIMYLIIIYVLPFVALLVLNSFLIRELMTMQKRNTNASRKEENEANLSLVLVLIVIVFILCQTPGLISQFDVIDVSVFLFWLGVSNLLFTTNSAVNFLIYTAFGRKFRRVLLRMFRRVSATKEFLRNRASSVSSSHAKFFHHTNANGHNLMEMSSFPLKSKERIKFVRDKLGTKAHTHASISTYGTSRV